MLHLIDQESKMLLVILSQNTNRPIRLKCVLYVCKVSVMMVNSIAKSTAVPSERQRIVIKVFMVDCI
jgi:hypothetical protein